MPVRTQLDTHLTLTSTVLHISMKRKQTPITLHKVKIEEILSLALVSVSVKDKQVFFSVTFVEPNTTHSSLYSWFSTLAVNEIYLMVEH